MSRPRGALVLGLVLVALLVWPVLLQDPYASDLVHGVGEGGGPSPPSPAHWLGTDRLFRDELARLVTAARHSLLIGVLAGALATAFGTVFGLVAGFLEGERVLVPLGTGRRLALHPDDAMVFVLDVMQSFPFLLLVLAAAAVFERTSDAVVVGVLAATGWLAVARLVRAKTIQLRGREFVLAARALGRSTVAIAWRHVLPNLGGLLLATASLLASQMIVAESVLAYLGLGASPDQPSWGRMLAEAQDSLLTAPWLFAWPALALLAAALTFQLVGLRADGEARS